MAVEHVEFHVEELSMEAALRALLPRMLGDVTFDVFPYQGKHDLLRELPKRLRGLVSWLPAAWRVVVIVDEDRSDCVKLRHQMDQIATGAGLKVRGGSASWQIANRIAIEELEAWYFGDWAAVRAAFPRVPEGVARQSNYRQSDRIRGGTWEAFERILNDAGYYSGGLQKIAAARAIAGFMELSRNTSPSFGKLRDVITEITTA